MRVVVIIEYDTLTGEDAEDTWQCIADQMREQYEGIVSVQVVTS